VTVVPIHTVVHTPSASAAPSHPDHAAPPAPGSPQATLGQPQPPHQDSLQNIRNDLNHHPGGLSEPAPADQQALANAVPRNEDGTPQRFPDPFGSWSQLQNDGGNTVPGRSNNCADCSRSFLETWYGNPQVSAPRTLDTDAHGNPDVWSPENNANDNQIRWTGAAHTYAGPGNNPDTANAISSTLQQAGHGSAAIVQVAWPGGGGHAFNAVNHHGNIIWIDTQSGQVSHDPLHLDNATHVWHIPLDADRNPIDTSQPNTANSEGSEGSDGSDGSDGSEHKANTAQDETDPSQDGTDNSPPDNGNQSSPDSPAPHTSPSDTTTHPDAPGRPSDPDQHTPPSTPANRPDHPTPAEPAGHDDNSENPDHHPYTDPHDRGDSDTSDESRRVTEDGPDSDTSRTHEYPESRDSREYGIEPDELQNTLRKQQEVHRVELDRVHDRLNRWAESGELTHVLQASSGDGPHPNPDGPKSFTRAQLSQSLEGFEHLSRGEQQAVVASLARLSHSFHEQHSVGAHPEPVTHPPVQSYPE
jgi:papain fold toxin 1 (glutamine deamidase) of polymorphic toxin system